MKSSEKHQISEEAESNDSADNTDFDRTYQTELFSTENFLGHNLSKGLRTADLIPFFIINRKQLTLTGRATPEEITEVRTIEIGGQTARLDQTAAIITARAGKNKKLKIYRHLGEREEHVLDALKQIAGNSAGALGLFQGSAALKFTIAQIIYTLDYSINYAETLDALDVLSGSITDLRIWEGSSNKVRPIRSALLPLLVSCEDETYSHLFNETDQSVYMCTFHPFITKDITSLNTRLINPVRIRKRRSYLARNIERRMSHAYVQASEFTPYGPIKASTLLMGAGIKYDRKKPPSHRFRALNLALEELTLPDNMQEDSFDASDFIISSYTRDPIPNGITGKEEDVYYTFYPTRHFVEQQKVANNAVNRDKDRMATANALAVTPTSINSLNIKSKKTGKTQSL